MNTKGIPNTKGYKINKDGTVIISPKGTILSSRITNKGYRIFHLGRDKRGKTAYYTYEEVMPNASLDN